MIKNQSIGKLAALMLLCFPTSLLTSQQILATETVTSSVMQQTKKVTGVVKDKNGDNIIGASVLVKGTTNGTITDLDGKFTLDAPDNGTLVVSYIGFTTQEVLINGKTTFQIKLGEDSKALEEVVVIGYGTRSKRDVTTAISNVDSETIGKTITMSAESAMQGTMSGVQVSGNTGNPMNRPTIRIRGTNSWGVSDPLYVIDGIAITEMGAGVEGQDERIEYITPNVPLVSLTNVPDISLLNVPLFTGCN